ncbi:hypothetical protein RJ639_000915 [Escallonia herrerae]|uniref:Uncharacterized protein n=1 Tax=Escallonia herrerae TaxID=1293975 RepID=A0AA88XA46_9ASTE|nr:hypothetical protein RJ639_000915 [Escallonia herrerae]
METKRSFGLIMLLLFLLASRTCMALDLSFLTPFHYGFYTLNACKHMWFDLLQKRLLVRWAWRQGPASRKVMGSRGGMKVSAMAGAGVSANAASALALVDD